MKRGDTKQREWANHTLAISERLRDHRDATSLVLSSLPRAEEKQRLVYDAKNGTNLPGRLVRSEGDPPTKDSAVDEAYDGAGLTYDLYKNAYERNSIDNNGLRLDSTVHYSRNYDNAFWNGSQMVYGDGDGKIFNRFTKSVDVIGHELTHGVTQFTAKLIYQDQPGALNEHISDVFGSLVKQYSLKQTADTADWLIGEGLFTFKINGKALRSMKAPGTAYDDPLIGKDPQPANMRDYKKMRYDNGGVHINSGIPNHAFYLIATEIGGFAWEKAGKIWYDTLTNRLDSKADFQEAANLTFEAAGALFGRESKEQEAVYTGWDGVGIVVKK